MTIRLQEPRRPMPLKEAADQLYEAFVGRLSVKTRAAEQKHVELCEAEAAQGYGELWKRLAVALDILAPYATETAGHQALKFHIPDGKYRQQVFALEDSRNGTISVYLPDVSARALQEKLIVAGEGASFRVPGLTDAPISLEIITSDTPDMAVCKPMLGWGRRALRASIKVTADDKHIKVIERLCELATETWVSKLPPEVKKP